MPDHVFALVDCDNFYASCERIFRPCLVGKPVVILSNNDGCIISRSNEAKALGITMGTPFYQCKPLIADHGIEVFSSNYALYGDISQRVMTVLSGFTPRLEIYSIDEAFLSLDHILTEQLESYGHQIQNHVRQWIGVPVSLGIGPTKTLAKIATRLAKKKKDYTGVCNLTGSVDIDSLLHQIEVEDIWGIGRNSAHWLKKNGIHTALHLKYSDEKWIEKHLTVVGLRIVLELRGTSCLPLEDIPLARKGIVCSRSFGRPVTRQVELEEALAEYCSRAAEKLRNQHSVAAFLQVFVMTNRFRKESYYCNSASIRLPNPSADTIFLVQQAHACLHRLFREGCIYQKVGVMLAGITPDQVQQIELFAETDQQDRRKVIMEALDRINDKWGNHSIRLASTGIDQTWAMRQAMRSNRYTTQWNELPIIKI